MQVEPEVPDRVSYDSGARNRHDYVPSSLGKVQNGGIVGGPHREHPPLIGEDHKENQGKKAQENLQDVSCPGPSQPIGDQVYPEVGSLSPQDRGAQEDHPGKGPFNDFISPSHRTNGNEPDEYSRTDKKK